MLKIQQIKITCYALGSLALGFFLIQQLENLLDDFSFGDLLYSLSEIGPIYAFLILASTLFHFWITAQKWKLITQQMSKKVSLRRGFFYYTSLIGLLAQFLPQQFCITITRTFALRKHEDISVTKGASSTLFDQGFEFLILATLSIPGFLTIFGIIETQTALALSVILLFSLWAGLMILVKYGISITEFFNKVLPWLITPLLPILNRIKKNISVSMYHFITKIYFLSIVRYINLLCRAYLIALATELHIPIISIIGAFPLVLLSAILSVTPANLGIAEWSWVGLLNLSDSIAPSIGLEFAIAQRILIFFSIIIINLFLIAYIVWRYFARDPAIKKA